jgi:uncharacterized protein
MEQCPTAKLEKLLLPTDGSEFNEGAIREAIKLAKTCSGKIIAVSVIQTNPEYEAIAPQLVEKEEKEAREHLESVKERASQKGVECEIIARHGEETYKCIVEEAEKNKVDMIVMGRRGRTGIKRLMLGSVTAKVIGHTSSNVLVVPREAVIECKNIIAATDGSKHGERAVYEALGIAKRCNSSLTIVTVITSEHLVQVEHSRLQISEAADMEMVKIEHDIKELKETAIKEGIQTESFILSGVPAEAIINTAKTKNADLIVMGSHGRTGIERLLVGSVTERVIVLSSSAVLVVKAGGK